MYIKKAFDLIDTHRLIHALNIIGIRGKSLIILTSYLSNRKQIVRINNALSDAEDISHEVLNIISKSSLSGKPLLHADDAILVY
jgi:hypothetical protein